MNEAGAFAHDGTHLSASPGLKSFGWEEMRALNGLFKYNEGMEKNKFEIYFTIAGIRYDIDKIYRERPDSTAVYLLGSEKGKERPYQKQLR